MTNAENVTRRKEVKKWKIRGERDERTRLKEITEEVDEDTK